MRSRIVLKSLISVIVGLILFAENSWPFEGVTSSLRNAMNAFPDSLLKINIIMKEQPSFAYFQSITTGMSKQERRETVISELKNIAKNSQHPVKSLLREMEKAGKVSDVHTLWIVNGINVKTTRDVIEKIFEFGGVRSIDLDERFPDEELDSFTPGRFGNHLLGSPPIEWGVQKINAPAVWDLGYTGQGVLVAVLDRGVNYNHHDLVDHMWDGTGQYFEYPEESGNWYELIHHGFDFEFSDNDPMDLYGHGTAVAGIVAGDGTVGEIFTGVAPDATIMALVTWGYESWMWDGIQFAIEKEADIVNQSNSWPYEVCPDYKSWRQATDNELAAGIIHFNSAGNLAQEQDDNPIPYNIPAPANSPPPWLHPDQTLIGGLSSVITCGATDHEDNLNLDSGRGPAAWQDIHEFNPNWPPELQIPLKYQDYPYDPPTYMGLLKPDVCGPYGVTTLSYWDNTGYRTNFGGTSAATPHVAGAAALLLSFDPNLNPASICRALQMTATNIPHKDNDIGAGRINAYWALLEAGAGIKGDMNRDMSVDVLDHFIMLDIILGYIEPDDYEQWAGDLNYDGEINVIDYMLLWNIITNGSGGRSLPDISSEPAVVYLSKVPGPTGDYGVILENSAGIAGVQLWISYNPQAWTPGEPQTTDRSAKLELNYRNEDGELMVMLASPTGDEIAPGTGPIVHVSSQKPGGSLHITRAILCTATGQEIPVDIKIMGAPKSVSQSLPNTFMLSQNYPNPFNPVTTIAYTLPEAARVKVEVYNLLGQLMEVLVDSEQQAGYHRVLWDASDTATGVYFYRLTSDSFTATKRMVLMK